MEVVDATLVEQIINVPQRPREPDVHHDRKADDLGAGLEVAEWGTQGHLGRRRHPCPASSRVRLTNPTRVLSLVRRRAPLKLGSLHGAPCTVSRRVRLMTPRMQDAFRRREAEAFISPDLLTERPIRHLGEAHHRRLRPPSVNVENRTGS